MNLPLLYATSGYFLLLKLLENSDVSYMLICLKHINIRFTHLSHEVCECFCMSHVFIRICIQEVCNILFFVFSADYYGWSSQGLMAVGACMFIYLFLYEFLLTIQLIYFQVLHFCSQVRWKMVTKKMEIWNILLSLLHIRWAVHLIFNQQSGNSLWFFICRDPYRSINIVICVFYLLPIGRGLVSFA